MSKNIRIIVLVFVIGFLLVSCGYKKIAQEKLSISLQNINITADKRIAYKLKNNILLISNEESKNKYNLDLNLIYKKTSKIIDKTGKTTRFNIAYTGNLKLKNIDTDENINKSFNVNGEYNIAEDYSDTINNRNTAINNIIEKLSNDITNFITLSFRTK